MINCPIDRFISCKGQTMTAYLPKLMKAVNQIKEAGGDISHPIELLPGEELTPKAMEEIISTLHKEAKKIDAQRLYLQAMTEEDAEAGERSSDVDAAGRSNQAANAGERSTSTLSGKYEELQRQFDDLEKLAEARRHKIGELEELAEAKLQEINDLKQQTVALQQHNEDLQQQISQIQSQASSLQMQTEQLKEENESLRASAEAAVTREEKARKKWTKLAESVIHFRDQIDYYKSEFEENEGEQADGGRAYTLLKNLYKMTGRFLTENSIVPLDAGDTFQVELHQVDSVIETHDQALDNTIAETIRVGYQIEGVVYRPQEVTIYQYKERRETDE
jgi:molecular chaperone GrpE (heat shock protein)